MGGLYSLYLPALRIASFYLKNSAVLISFIMHKLTAFISEGLL